MKALHLNRKEIKLPSQKSSIRFKVHFQLDPRKKLPTKRRLFEDDEDDSDDDNDMSPKSSRLRSPPPQPRAAKRVRTVSPRTSSKRNVATKKAKVSKQQSPVRTVARRTRSARRVAARK